MGEPGRPDKVNNPMDGRLPKWADTLKAAIARAPGGKPKLVELCKRTGLSKSVLSAASCGKVAPSWDTTVKLLKAIGEDPEEWRGSWALVASKRQLLAAGAPAVAAGASAYRRIFAEEVETAKDLIIGLRQLRVVEGRPTYMELYKRSMKSYTRMPPATTSALLNSEKLPRLDTLDAFLSALGTGERRKWIAAWKRVSAKETADTYRRKHLAIAAAITDAESGTPETEDPGVEASEVGKPVELVVVEESTEVSTLSTETMPPTESIEDTRVTVSRAEYERLLAAAEALKKMGGESTAA